MIKMRTATTGIRSTDFLAGEMKGGHGVILMHREADVYNEAGMVTLREAYEGTINTSADEAPGEPTIWNEGNQKKALAGVSFTNSPLCTMLQKVARDVFRSCI